MDDERQLDFFISYTADDRGWAEWIARVLREGGYSTFLQSEDIRPGHDFLHEMQRATARSQRTLAVLSPRYCMSEYGEMEWRARLHHDPSGEQRLLVPVRVAECEPPDILRSRVLIDLVGLEEQSARSQLLDGVAAELPPGHGHEGFPGPVPGGPRATGLADGPPATPRFPGPTPSMSWEQLRTQRPSVEELLGPDRLVLGHSDLRHLLRDRRDGADTVSLVLCAGPAGSGKTSVLRWLESAGGRRVVHVNTVLRQLRLQLRGAALEVEHLIEQLRPAMGSAGAEAVLAYDDADHDLLHAAIVEFIRVAFEELDPALLVVMTSTALATELFPVPTRTRVLDQRRAGFEEFDRFLDLVLDAAGTPRSTFTSQLRDNLYDLSEQTPDFRAVHQVVEMLVAHHRKTGASIRPTVLRSLLEHERQAHVLQLPEVAAGPRLMFRRKDKSELLAAVLRRRFPDPLAFASVAARQLDPFDAAEFLAEAQRSDRSYRLALTSLCLTHSPGDLVLSLLTPEQVGEEIADLHLDPVHGTRSAEEQAHLLVRGIGFTLVDPPVGLQDFKAAVMVAKALVEDADKSTERLLGATSTVVVHVEAALRDLLHFWATYLFDSIGDLVKTRNARTPGRQALVVRNLPTDGVVDLLHFLNAEAQGEDFRFRLAAVELGQPLSGALLAACDAFLEHRRVFTAVPGASVIPVEEATALQQRCERLVQSAADLLDQAADGSFPTVIKLSEIVFDEYSRRIFLGVDSEGGQVRFGITERQDPEDLVVAAHYYMLPNKRVSVNPRLVPRAGRKPQVLFDSGRRYESASLTQRRQGHRLLTFVDLYPDARVLEVGCGTGALALDVARRVAHLHGIDVSPEMLSVAEDRAEEAGLDNLTFEVADLLDYEAPEPFDLVLSNSTMHWILPPERAYGRLLRALSPGGRLAVHQGGAGNYRGLRECVSRVIRRLRLSEFFDGWKYPVYYPDPVELRDLLVSLGFDDVDVHPEESDGSESPTLVHDFAVAGLLPFLHVLPETQREVLRTAFLEEAASTPPDLYTHRLYVTARHP